MGIFDLFFDKYVRLNGTKCLLKKKEVLKLCGDFVAVDRNRTGYIIQKIDFDNDFIIRFKNKYQGNNLGKFHRYIAQYIPYISKITETREQLPFQFKYLDMTLDEMKSIVFDFYREIDKKYIKRHDWVSYLEGLKDDPNFTSNEKMSLSERNGDCSVGVTDNRLILTLNLSNSCTGLAAIAHEFGHLLSQSSRERAISKLDCIVEIESLFMEMVFVDWLGENGKLSQNQVNQYWVYDNNKFVGDCLALSTENELVSRMAGEITKGRFKHFSKEIKGQKNEQRLLCKVINIADKKQKAVGPYLYRYVVGRTISYALFEEYKKNPEETMQKFDSYLRCCSDITSLDEAGKMLLGENYKTKVLDCLFTPEQQKEIADRKKELSELHSVREKN